MGEQKRIQEADARRERERREELLDLAKIAFHAMISSESIGRPAYTAYETAGMAFEYAQAFQVTKARFIPEDK